MVLETLLWLSTTLASPQQIALRSRVCREISGEGLEEVKTQTSSSGGSPDIPTGGADDVEKRLGQSWDPVTDVLTFSAMLRVNCGKEIERFWFQKFKHLQDQINEIKQYLRAKKRLGRTRNV